VTYLIGTVICHDRLDGRAARTSLVHPQRDCRLGWGAALRRPPLIIAGLILCAACGMLCQTIATGYVTSIAKEGRSSAVGLYVTSFYIGGSMGAFLPGLAWNAGGWTACIAMVVAMLATMALIAALAYRGATA
jgi:predicted MFS family arabinose efflux permease